jgi:hypothetical protein
LLTALSAVFFACLGARRELNRTLLLGQLREWELNRDYAATRVDDPQEGAHWRKLSESHYFPLNFPVF